MRVITPEQQKEMKEGDGAIAYILNTPKPDFTELQKICKEFENAMIKAQAEDKKKILEALKK